MSEMDLPESIEDLKAIGAALQKLIDEDAPEAMIRAHQYRAAKAVTHFIVQTVGEAIRQRPMQQEPITAYLADSIVSWYGLLGTNAIENRRLWLRVADEIRGFEYGDEADTLKPKAKAKGQPRKPLAIAKARLWALAWAEYFRERGVRPKYYQAAISLAFATNWDAVRHWRSSAEKVLGSDETEWRLNRYREQAHDLMSESSSPQRKAISWLAQDGKKYRSLIGLPYYPARDFHRDWEKEARSLSVPPSIMDV